MYSLIKADFDFLASSRSLCITALSMTASLRRESFVSAKSVYALSAAFPSHSGSLSNLPFSTVYTSSPVSIVQGVINKFS